MDELIELLTNRLGLSPATAQALLNEFGEAAVQTHAQYCAYAMSQGRVRNPPAWFTASLRQAWKRPYGMPATWDVAVLTFRLDATTFAEVRRAKESDAETKAE